MPAPASLETDLTGANPAPPPQRGARVAHLPLRSVYTVHYGDTLLGVSDPLAGRYAPYYTPQNMQTHSATGAVMLRPTSLVTVRASGSYGVHATENAPFFQTSSGLVQSPPVLSYYRRTFHPWNARAALSANLPAGVTASLYGEHMRTAFWASTAVGVEISRRFVRQ